MAKNQFMKSRKQKKTRGPAVKPKDKLYCPPTMVRYDITKTGYNTLWACKICLTCPLSEEAVRSHLMICNTSTIKKTYNQQPIKDELNHYICETCDRVFSRSVTLKRHLEVHKKRSSDLDSEQSDNDMIDDGKDAEVVEADLKEEYGDESD